MVTKTSASTKAAGKTTAAASKLIARKSLTVAVGQRSSLSQITKALEKQLKEAGCAACLSGLERLVIDSRINVR